MNGPNKLVLNYTSLEKLPSQNHSSLQSPVVSYKTLKAHPKLKLDLRRGLYYKSFNVGN